MKDEAAGAAAGFPRHRRRLRASRHARTVIISTIAFWTSIAFAENLIPEPGFEFAAPQASPWKLDWYSEDRGTLRLDDAEAATGDQSLFCEISAPDQFAYWTLENLAIPAGVKYLKLSVTCRAENVQRAMASMGLSFHDKDGYWMDHRLFMVLIAQDTGWERYEGYAQIPPNVVTMNVVGWANILVNGTGKFWFDDLELVPSDHMVLPETVFRDTAATPEADAIERERGFRLFSRDYTRVLFSSAVPRAEERVRELRIAAAPGEFEPVVLAVHGLRNLRDVSVIVGPLRSDSASLPATVMDVRSVTFRSRAGDPLSGPFTETLMKDAPLLLETRDKVAIAQGETQPFWLTVHVPAGTAPGTYAGSVSVRTSETVAHLPLRLTVWPFELAEPENATFAMYANMQEDEARIRENFADMRAHGLTSVGLYGGLGVDITLVDGTPVVHWNGESPFEKNLKLYAEAGFPRPLLWLMGGDVHQFCLDHADLASPEFAALYRSIAEQIVERGKTLGWPEIIFQTIDEPYDQLHLLPMTLTLMEILKTIPNVRTEMDGVNAAWDHFTDHAYALTDVFVLHDGPVLHRGRLEPQKWAEFIERVRDDGKEVWFYNIDISAWRPEPLRFLWGFGLWMSGATGNVQWSYMTSVDMEHPERAYDTPDALIFRFPATSDRSGGPTIGYEAIREGIDDYRYLHTLQRLLDEARSSGSSQWARDAEALWSPIQAKLEEASFDGSKGRKAQGVWTGPFEPTPAGPRYVSGDHKIANNWSLEDYAALRLQIAKAIVQLRQSRP